MTKNCSEDKHIKNKEDNGIEIWEIVETGRENFKNDRVTDGVTDGVTQWA